MPAYDKLNKVLFHGTGHYFDEGETIKPSTGHVVHGEHSNTPLSFATTDIRRARSRAGMKAASMGMLFAPVYSVEAPDDVQVKPGDLVDRSDHISKEGHVIQKIVDWGVNKNIQPIDPEYK